MSSCWKCGKKVSEGQTECEYGCGKAEHDAQVQRVAALIKASEFVPIDWDKVKTIDDFRTVLSVLHSEVRILKGSPCAIALKNFLRSDNSTQ